MSYNEIKDYMDRFRDCSPEEILDYLGALRDFFLENMTHEGKMFFVKTKLKEQMGDYYSEGELEKVLKKFNI